VQEHTHAEIFKTSEVSFSWVTLTLKVIIVDFVEPSSRCADAWRASCPEAFYIVKTGKSYWLSKLLLSQVVWISIAHPRAMQNTLLACVNVVGFFFNFECPAL